VPFTQNNHIHFLSILPFNLQNRHWWWVHSRDLWSESLYSGLKPAL